MVLSNFVEFYYVIQESADPIIVFSRTAVISLLFFYCMRHLFIGDLFRTVKKMDKDLNKSIRKNFFKKSYVGWIFFIIGLAIFEIMSFRANWLLQYLSFYVWTVIGILIFFIGIYFHLYTFTKVIIDVVRKRLDIEKN